MSSAQQQAILIKPNDGAAAFGVLHGTAYDERDRVRRAAKTLAVYWGLAPLLFFTFVPIVHLIGAGALLVAGPVAAALRYRTTYQSDQATGTCPVCKNAVTIRLEPAERLPLWKYCPLCHAPLQLVAQSNA